MHGAETFCIIRPSGVVCRTPQPCITVPLLELTRVSVDLPDTTTQEAARPSTRCNTAQALLHPHRAIARAERIRTSDLRVMSSNPISYTVDRRATHLRVTFRSWVVQSPAHCEMLCGTLYLECCTCQTRLVQDALPPSSVCRISPIGLGLPAYRSHCVSIRVRPACLPIALADTALPCDYPLCKDERQTPRVLCSATRSYSGAILMSDRRSAIEREMPHSVRSNSSESPTRTPSGPVRPSRASSPGTYNWAWRKRPDGG